MLIANMRAIYFNPHSRKGSDIGNTGHLSNFWNFNPHSRKGSDGVVYYNNEVMTSISIHTPARGVTLLKGEGTGAFLISIHTPARGVTGVVYYNNEVMTSISIHTPARGVTAKIHIFSFKYALSFVQNSK